MSNKKNNTVSAETPWNEYGMEATKMFGLTALFTFIGGTAFVGNMAGNVVGPVPSVALATGAAAGVSSIVLNYMNW